MATLPLMTVALPLEQLLTELVANESPLPPSFWPLAPIYWLLIAATACVMGFFLWRWWRLRGLRTALRQMLELQQVDDLQQQSLMVHQVLRVAAQRWRLQSPSQTPDQFALFVQNTLQLSHPPSWLNAHYKKQPHERIDWQQVEQLIRHWYRGTAS